MIKYIITTDKYRNLLSDKHWFMEYNIHPKNKL